MGRAEHGPVPPPARVLLPAHRVRQAGDRDVGPTTGRARPAARGPGQRHRDADGHRRVAAGRHDGAVGDRRRRAAVRRDLPRADQRRDRIRLVRRRGRHRSGLPVGAGPGDGGLARAAGTGVGARRAVPRGLRAVAGRRPALRGVVRQAGAAVGQPGSRGLAGHDDAADGRARHPSDHPGAHAGPAQGRRPVHPDRRGAVHRRARAGGHVRRARGCRPLAVDRARAGRRGDPGVPDRRARRRRARPLRRHRHVHRRRRLDPHRSPRSATGAGPTCSRRSTRRYGASWTGSRVGRSTRPGTASS